MPTAVTPTSRETTLRLPGGPGVIAFAAVSLTFLLLFYRWFWKQHHFAAKNLDDWGHTYLIPIIAGWLLWQQRQAIARATPTAFWPGLIPMAMGIFCYVFALVVVPNHMLQGFSVILALFGAVLLILGPDVMRRVFLPIAYLVFAVTIAERIMLLITFQLQLIASRGSWVLLSIIGAPFGWFSTDIEGNTLELVTSSGSVIPLNVAEACSGMRMVVAFIALAGFVALISAKEWWQRLLLMFLAAPVAILMNIIRVAVLGLLSLADPNLAAGEAHTLIGTLLLFPALMLYLGIVWALERVIKSEPMPKAATTGKPEGGRSVLDWSWSRAQLAAVTITVVVFGMSAVALGSVLSAFDIQLQKKPIYPESGRLVNAIPVETESWIRVGTDRLESSEIVSQLGTTNYLNRTYTQKHAPEGERPAQIELHLAYYTGMIDTVPHVPERCFVGGGMRQSALSATLPLVMDTSLWRADPTAPAQFAGDAGAIYTARLPSDPEYTDAPGIRVRLPRGVTPESPLRMRISSFDVGDQVGALHAGYFFIANGGTVASAEQVRNLAFDLTSDYAFYLKVQTTSVDAGSPDHHAELSGSLLSELIGEIMRCVPDWVDVQQEQDTQDSTTQNNG